MGNAQASGQTPEVHSPTVPLYQQGSFSGTVDDGELPGAWAARQSEAACEPAEQQHDGGDNTHQTAVHLQLPLHATSRASTRGQGPASLEDDRRQQQQASAPGSQSMTPAPQPGAQLDHPYTLQRDHGAVPTGWAGPEFSRPSGGGGGTLGAQRSSLGSFPDPALSTTSVLAIGDAEAVDEAPRRDPAALTQGMTTTTMGTGPGAGGRVWTAGLAPGAGVSGMPVRQALHHTYQQQQQHQQQQVTILQSAAAAGAAGVVPGAAGLGRRETLHSYNASSISSISGLEPSWDGGGALPERASGRVAEGGPGSASALQRDVPVAVAVQPAAAAMPVMGYGVGGVGGGRGGWRRDSPGRQPEGAVGVSVSVGGWQRGMWGGVEGGGEGEGVLAGTDAMRAEGRGPGQQSSEVSEGQAEEDGQRPRPVPQRVGSRGLPPRRGGRAALPEDFSSGSEESDEEPDGAWKGVGGLSRGGGGGRGYGFFDAAASGDGGHHARTDGGAVGIAGRSGERLVPAEGTMAGAGVKRAVGSRSSSGSESGRRSAHSSGGSAPGLGHGSGVPPPPAGEHPDSTAVRYPSGSERWGAAPFCQPSRRDYVGLGPDSHHQGPADSGADVVVGGSWAAGGGVGSISGNSSGSRPRIASAAPSGGSGSGGVGTAGTGSAPRIGSVDGSGGGVSEQPSAGRLSGEGSLRSGGGGGGMGSEPSSLSGEDLPGVGGLERHVPSWHYRRDSSDGRVSDRDGDGGDGGGGGTDGFGAVRSELGAGVGEGGAGGGGGAAVAEWGASGRSAVGPRSQDGTNESRSGLGGSVGGLQGVGGGSGGSRGVGGGVAAEHVAAGDLGAAVGVGGGGSLGWASDWFAPEPVSGTRNWWDEDDAAGPAADQGQAQQQGEGQQGGGAEGRGSERTFGEEEGQPHLLPSWRQRDESDSGGLREMLEQPGDDKGELGEAQGASAGPASPSGAEGTAPSGAAGSLEQHPGGLVPIASSSPAGGSVPGEQHEARAASRASSGSQEALNRTSTHSLDQRGTSPIPGGQGAAERAEAPGSRLPSRAPSAGALPSSDQLPPRYPSSTSLDRRATGDSSAQAARASEGDASHAQHDTVPTVEPPTTTLAPQGLGHRPAAGAEWRANAAATGVGTAYDSMQHTSAAALMCAGGSAGLPLGAPGSQELVEPRGPLERTTSARPGPREVYTREAATSASLPREASEDLCLPPRPARSALAVAKPEASPAFAEAATQYCPVQGCSDHEEDKDGRLGGGDRRGGSHKRVRVEQAGGAAGAGSGERPMGRGHSEASSGTTSEWELEAMVPPAPATGEPRPWLDAALLAIACGQGRGWEQGPGQQPCIPREERASGDGVRGPPLQLPPFHVGAVPGRRGKARREEVVSAGGAAAGEDGDGDGDALMTAPSAVSTVGAAEGVGTGLAAEDSRGNLAWQAQLPAWLPHYANAPEHAATAGVLAGGSPGEGKRHEWKAPHTTASLPKGSAHSQVPHMRLPMHHDVVQPLQRQQQQHNHPHFWPEGSWPGELSDGPKAPLHAGSLRPSYRHTTDAHPSPMMASLPDDQAYPTQLRPARAPGLRGPAPESELQDGPPSPQTRTRGTSSPGGYRQPGGGAVSGLQLPQQQQQQQQQQQLHILPSQVHVHLDAEAMREVLTQCFRAVAPLAVAAAAGAGAGVGPEAGAARAAEAGAEGPAAPTKRAAAGATVPAGGADDARTAAGSHVVPSGAGQPPAQHGGVPQASSPRPSTTCNAATQTADTGAPLAAASTPPSSPLSHNHHHHQNQPTYAPASPPTARSPSPPPIVDTAPATATITTTTTAPAPVYFRSGVAAVLYDVLRRDVRKRAAEDGPAPPSDPTAPPLAPVWVAPIAAAAATSSTSTGLFGSVYRASGSDAAAAIAASAASGVVFDSEADAAAWAAYGPLAASGTLAPSGNSSWQYNDPAPTMGVGTGTGAGVTGVLRPGSSIANTITTAAAAAGTPSLYLQHQSAPKRQRLSPPGPGRGVGSSYPWSRPGGVGGAPPAALGAAGGGLAPASSAMRAHAAGLLGANPALARFAPPSMSSALSLPHASSVSASLTPPAVFSEPSVATGLASWGPEQLHRVQLGSSGEAFSEAVGGWLEARATAAVRAATSVTGSRGYGFMPRGSGGRGGGGAEHSMAAVSGVSYAASGGGGMGASGSVAVGGSVWAGAAADTRALAPEELFGSYGKLGEGASMRAAWGAGLGPVGMDAGAGAGAGAEPWLGVAGGQRASGVVQEEGGQVYGSPPLPRAPSVMLRRFLDQRSPA